MEAYKIGVTVALLNNASAGLMALSIDFRHTDERARALEASMRRIKTLTEVGLASATVGWLGVREFEKAYDAAKTYEGALNRLRAYNLGEQQFNDAKKSIEAANLYGVSRTQIANAVGEAYGVMGDMKNALMVAPVIAQMQFANEAVFGDRKGGRKFDDAQAVAAMKVVEMRGGYKSPEAMQQQLDMIQKVMTGTAGLVMPSDMLAFMKTGGTAAKNLSDQAFYFGMEPLIQEMGGNRVGTGLMSAFQNAVLGKSTTAAATELAQLHLVDPSKMSYDTTGRIKKIKPGALLGNSVFQSDPQQWVETYLIPALTKDGELIDQQKLEKVAYLFGNRTASMLISTMLQQQDKVAKNVAMDTKAMGISQMLGLAKGTPQGAEAALGSAWNDFQVAAGEVVIPVVVPALVKLTEALRAIGDWARAHPVAFQKIVEMTGALTGLAVAAGSIALATAGLLALGPALVPLAAIFGGGALISAITIFGDDLRNGLGDLAHLLANAVDAIFDPIRKELGLDTPAGVALGSHAPTQWAGNNGANLQDPNHPHGRVGMPGAPPAQSQPIVVQSTINLDGQKIAKVVTAHQYGAANGPPTSVGTFDGRQSYVPAVP